jgi:hypothetical protein
MMMITLIHRDTSVAVDTDTAASLLPPLGMGPAVPARTEAAPATDRHRLPTVAPRTGVPMGRRTDHRTDPLGVATPTRRHITLR